MSIKAPLALLLLHTLAETISVERLSAVAAGNAIVLGLARRLVQHNIRFVAARLSGGRRRGDILTG